MFASRKDIIGFDDRWILLFGIPVVSLLVNTLLFGHLLKEGDYLVYSECFPVSIYFTVIYWLVFREANFWLIKKMPLYEDIRKRQLISVIGIFVGYYIIDFVALFILESVIGFSLEEDLNPNTTLKLITSIIFTFLTFVVYESFYLANLLGKSRMEKQKLIAENIESKLSGLQSQINPHFLFNSLNTLSALIQEDPNRADKFVVKLSKVYRHILDYKDTGLVTIESELSYLNAYFHLLKERFGESLQFSINIDQQLMSKYILPFSLQITFENCVKHNAVTKDHPLKVRLYSDHSSDYLCIENNIIPLAEKDESTSVGLQNIKNRYAYFSDRNVLVSGDEHCFKVCLPILNKNQTKHPESL